MCRTVDEATRAALKKWREEIQHGKYSRAIVQSAIDDYIFSERTRRMLARRLFDGIKFEPLAEEFELSTRQAKTIIYDAELILIAHLP